MTAAPPARPRVSRRTRRLLTAAAVVLPLALGAWNLWRAPHAAWLPVAIGLLPFVVGKYVVCPLRWHQLSVSGQSRRWHLRVYAESELLGLMSPAHVAADYWRMRMLERVGLHRSTALADVALDRLVGSLALVVFAAAAGASLPLELAAVAVLVACALGLVAMGVRRWRPHLMPRREMPEHRHLVRGIAMSVAYQVTVVGLLYAAVHAVGYTVEPLALLALFGASQVAAVIPGIQGASPREGALAAGLVHLGLPVKAALGAVSLSAVIAWLPALLLGGTALVVRRLAARQGAPVLAG